MESNVSITFHQKLNHFSNIPLCPWVLFCKCSIARLINRLLKGARESGTNRFDVDVDLTMMLLALVLCSRSI